jgi:hypothetical protein
MCSTRQRLRHGHPAIQVAAVDRTVPQGHPWNRGSPDRADRSAHHVRGPAILERPAYAKFMVVPNYTYLKLKILVPKGIITVGTTYQCAFECDAECFQFAEALVRSERLRADPPSEDHEIPSPSERPTLSSPPRTLRMRSSSMMVVCSVSGRRSILNRKAHLSTSSKRTSMCLHGNPPT